MRTLLAHRDARFYLAGQVLSTVGDNALWLATGIWVKSSPAAAAPARAAPVPVREGGPDEEGRP